MGGRLHPAGAYAVIRNPLHESTGRLVDLDDLVGRTANELVQQCVDLPNAESRVRCASRWISARIACSRGVDPRVLWSATQIERSNGAVAISRIQERTGLSKKRLIQGFREQIGVTCALIEGLSFSCCGGGNSRTGVEECSVNGNRADAKDYEYRSAIVNAYDFSKFERIVDVGGGHGALLIGILSTNPHVRGVLHDLPGVVDGASVPPQKSVADRLEIIAGDFFEAVPPGADAYLMSGIIHDWDDEHALRILKTCRRAMRPDSRLLILDAVLTPSSDPARAMMDVLMMVLTGGRERTESEFRSLLDAAGFSLMNVVPTMGASILENCPI